MPLSISNYLASFRRKLQYPLGITRKQRFCCLIWMYDRVDSKRALQLVYPKVLFGNLCLNYNWRALVHEIEQFDHVRIPHPDTTAAVWRADLVLVFRAMDVDEAVACIGILLV